ncbi:unnamed protein product [Gongylonema pulchrum]|uniref:Hexosyltransferase n=1 Tax=Gongylonema pulchrum TaxID=637853 RepID=A0A183DF91_9BILA|nr:unnamed protein product [Gongylonema pulchrum]
MQLAVLVREIRMLEFQGDPDIAAFPESITTFALKLNPHIMAVYGKCWKGARASRDENSKWALNPMVYASVTYPTYLAGGAWLFSPATAGRLLEALNKPFPYIHIDDTLVSGIFAEVMDVKRVCLSTVGHSYNFEPLNQCRNDEILAVLELEQEEVLQTLLNVREASLRCRLDSF